MAEIKYIDENGLLYTWQKIKEKLGDKVDKVEGKTLTSNDYTTEDKNKLSGIATGAQVNVIETVKVNGVALSITDKGIDVTVPTNNNQLTNGAGYQTASEVTSAINEAIKDISGIKFEIVTELPETGKVGVIYLLNNGSAKPNVYDEYIWVNDGFEKIGTTDIDLSGYVKFTDMVPVTNAEIDTIIAS